MDNVVFEGNSCELPIAGTFRQTCDFRRPTTLKCQQTSILATLDGESRVDFRSNVDSKPVRAKASAPFQLMDAARDPNLLFSSLVLSSQELSDTKVYEPQIQARLGTAEQLCEVVVLKL